MTRTRASGGVKARTRTTTGTPGTTGSGEGFRYYEPYAATCFDCLGFYIIYDPPGEASPLFNLQYHLKKYIFSYLFLHESLNIFRNLLRKQTNVAYKFFITKDDNKMMQGCMQKATYLYKVNKADNNKAVCKCLHLEITFSPAEYILGTQEIFY